MKRLKSAMKRGLQDLAVRTLSVNVRIKILGIALGVAFSLGSTTIIFLRIYLTRTWIDDLELRAVQTAQNAAARATDLILTNDLFSLYELFRRTVESSPDVRYAFVLDENGDVLVHTFTGVFPPDLLTVNIEPTSEPYRIELFESEEGRIHDIAVPVLDGRVGMVRIGVSENRLRTQMSILTANLIVFTILASLGGVASAVLLTYVLTHPIMELMEATSAVQRGDFTYRVHVSTEDEFGKLAASFNEMIERLAAMETQRSQLLKRLLTIQEEERNRIAHELHDHTGQALTSILLRLKMANRAESIESAREQIADLRKVVARTLDEVRLLAFEMRPAVLHDLGLAAALEHEARQFAERHEMHVDCHIRLNEGVPLPMGVQTAVYRIVREALTNIARHAHAQNVSILAQCRDDSLIVIVEDDGVGFDTEAVARMPVEHRFGLLGMAERARLVGGTVTLESSSGRGTSVFVHVPISSIGDEKNVDQDRHRG